MYTKEEIEELKAKDKVATYLKTVFKSLYPLLKEMERDGEVELDEQYGDVRIITKSGTKRVSGLDFWHRMAEYWKNNRKVSFVQFLEKPL